jgi:hypothetical protein
LKLFQNKDPTKNRVILELELKNLSEYELFSTKGEGSVHMSYHWLDNDGNVEMDGIRSAIVDKIQPGQKASIDIITPLPKWKGEYQLQLSPVQEGCSWFYTESPSLKNTFKFKVIN